MSNPVSGTGQAPTFGGLTGYKRPAPGKPTSVPGGLPAFRGRTNKPGDQVRTPTITASKNRHDRGTNVTIPYARICPIDHLANVGRISPGDVVFTSRHRVAMHHVATQREQRIVGVDFLNKALGNDDKQRVPGSAIHPNWVVGETVLLGGNSASEQVSGAQPLNDLITDYVGSSISDDWREASFLREWVCDGVVISNDEPFAHTSNGSRDVQQFNICVQGRSAVNNGYVDFSGRGVESLHRSQTDRQGYKDDGEPMRSHDFGTAIGGPYYNSYPLQMFDRKIKPLSNCFVGLVATKRVMDAQVKAALLRNSKLRTDSRDYLRLTTPTDENNVFETFYTFKFVYFTDRAMWQQAAVGTGNNYLDNWAYAEPPGKKQRPMHHEDAVLDKSNKNYDQFEPCSVADYRGMVGAWRIGKCLDTAASRKDQYMGGPIDTADQITLNVNLEWLDWRALRRATGRVDIGGWVAGAPVWMINPIIEVKDQNDQVIDFADTDDNRTLMWPTEYVLSTDKVPRAIGEAAAQASAAAGDDAAAQALERVTATSRYKITANMPMDMTTLDTLQDVLAQARDETALLGLGPVELAAKSADVDAMPEITPAEIKAKTAARRALRYGDLLGPKQANWDAAKAVVDAMPEATEAERTAKADAGRALGERPEAPKASHAKDGYGQVARRTTEGNERGLFALKTVTNTQTDDYVRRIVATSIFAGSDDEPLGIQRRIEAIRRNNDDAPPIPADDYDRLWASLTGAFGSAPSLVQFQDWYEALAPVRVTDWAFVWIQAIAGSKIIVDIANWNAIPLATRRQDAQDHYQKARFFTNGQPRQVRITKDVFERYVRAKESDATGLSVAELAGVAGSLERGVNRVIAGLNAQEPNHEAEAMLATAATAATFSKPTESATRPEATVASMDTGAGVGLSFGIAAPSAAASKPKAPAPARRKADAPTAPTAPTATPMDTSAIGETVAAPPAPKPHKAAAASVEAAAAAPARAGRPAPARTQRPGTEGTAEIFSSIFGSSAPAGSASTGAPAGGGAANDDSDASSDHAPSPAAPAGAGGAGARSRVRRARDGR